MAAAASAKTGAEIDRWNDKTAKEFEEYVCAKLTEVVEEEKAKSGGAGVADKPLGTIDLRGTYNHKKFIADARFYRKSTMLDSGDIDKIVADKAKVGASIAVFIMLQEGMTLSLSLIPTPTTPTTLLVTWCDV